MPENASIVLYTFTFRKAGSPLSHTGEGAREVLGTSSITEGLRSDDSLITDPVRDLPRILAREPLALSMDWYVVPFMRACLILSSIPTTPISPNTYRKARKDKWTFRALRTRLMNIRELKQRPRRRQRQRHLKKWIHAASNFFALVPSRLIRQILAKVFGAEF